MHNQPDTLGNIIKLARENQGITVETLYDKVGITERYLYRIENEGKKPSFDVLFRLIQELSLSADNIFYPEKQIYNSEIDTITRMLYTCDQQALFVVKATISSLIDTYCKK